MGDAISAGESTASATWYSRGWKVWWFLRSTTVTWTGARARALAALIPAKPAPRMTTRGSLGFCVIGNIVVSPKAPYTVDDKSVTGDAAGKRSGPGGGY